MHCTLLFQFNTSTTSAEIHLMSAMHFEIKIVQTNRDKTNNTNNRVEIGGDSTPCIGRAPKSKNNLTRLSKISTGKCSTLRGALQLYQIHKISSQTEAL